MPERVNLVLHQCDQRRHHKRQRNASLRIGTSPSLYRIPVAAARGRAVITNTMPTTSYRAAGRPEVMYVIERLIETYLELRESEHERFVDVVHRTGIEPFKKHVYANPDQRPSDRRTALAA